MADKKTIPAGKYGATLLAVTIAEEYLQSGTMPAPVTDDVTEREKAAALPLTVITTDKAMEKAGEQVTNGRTLALDNAPELDPTSPQYNPQAYNKRLQELAADIADTKAMLYEGALESAGDIMAHLFGAAEMIKPQISNIIDALPNIVNGLQKALENLAGIDWELLPYISKEMDKPENKALLENCRTMKDLTKAPEWQAILKAARQAKAEDENKPLPTLDGEKLKGINYPISKVNKEVWDKARDEVSGQYKLSVDTTPNADPVQVSVNMDALPPEVLRNLSHYDRRVWTAAVSLWVQGCRVVSAANIFYAMGNNSKPNPDQIEKIDRSMYKMGATYIQIDNMNEAASTNYDLFFRDKFYLLKVEGTSAINPANGKVISSAYILPEDEPKLLTFARMRGQVTTINRAVYAAPISQSENGLKLHDFLIDRIITMKREPQYSHKIKLATVCEYMGTTPKHKDRLKDQIANLLTYFADPNGGNFIAGWRTTTKTEERKEPAGYYIELKAEALPDNTKGKK